MVRLEIEEAATGWVSLLWTVSAAITIDAERMFIVLRRYGTKRASQSGSSWTTFLMSFTNRASRSAAFW